MIDTLKEHGWSPDINLSFTRTPTHIYWEDGNVAKRTGVMEAFRFMPTEGPSVVDYSLWTDAQREEAKAEYAQMRQDYEKYEKARKEKLRKKLIPIRAKLTKSEWYTMYKNLEYDEFIFTYDELGT